MELQGKKILFLSASFFGYSESICNSLKDLGAEVDYFDERPANSVFVKALIRINPKLLRAKIDNYHRNIIDSTKNKMYDYIFIIKAESISISSLKKLRSTHPNARFVLYLWDSINNFKTDFVKIKEFDKVFSFDKGDSEKYGMEFRPLFYTGKYAEIADITVNIPRNILFVGTIHSDRYAVLHKIKQRVMSDSRGVYFYMFFMSRLLYFKMKYLNLGLKNCNMSDFHFTSISTNDIIELLKKSDIVVDVNHPKQTGLTMRSIEVLGAKRKLITTNAAIKGYDFYNPNNILVIDRYNPIISDIFLDSKYEEIDDSVYEKYSLESWVLDVIN